MTRVLVFKRSQIDGLRGGWTGEGKGGRVTGSGALCPPAAPSSTPCLCSPCSGSGDHPCPEALLALSHPPPPQCVRPPGSGVRALRTPQGFPLGWAVGLLPPQGAAWPPAGGASTTLAHLAGGGGTGSSLSSHPSLTDAMSLQGPAGAAGASALGAERVLGRVWARAEDQGRPALLAGVEGMFGL